jgi:hypothetical protein
MRFGHHRQFEHPIGHVIVGDGYHERLRKEITRDGDCADAVHAPLRPANNHDIGPLSAQSRVRDVARTREQTKIAVATRRVDALIA